MSSSRTQVVVAGHVDHGKSTLLGQLLLLSGAVPQDKIETVQKACSQKGIAFEPAFLFDALKEEQEQGISIDTTRVNLTFGGKDFVLIDVPGHLEFLKNMTGGAASAQLGILIVDCLQGVKSQTERHVGVLALLGLKEIVCVVNKLDAEGYSQSVFDTTCKQVRDLLRKHNVIANHFVPVSALLGDNICTTSDKTDWYHGSTLTEAVLEWVQRDAFASAAPQPLRFILQDVYKFETERFYVGQVLSGSVKVGDELVFLPSAKRIGVRALRKFPQGDVHQAGAGEGIALVLDEEIFLDRGEVALSHGDTIPVDTTIQANAVWLSSEELDPGRKYLLKLGTKEIDCRLLLTSSSPERIANGTFLSLNIQTDGPVAFDDASESVLSKLVICTESGTVAAASIANRVEQFKRSASPAITVPQKSHITRDDRERLNGHKGAVLWLTGVSGAGKSTLAQYIEKYLFAQGAQSKIIDADNLRLGLNADLSFTREDRHENIRRLAHVGKLFLEQGVIAIVACISPYIADREMAKSIIGADDFLEVFLFCPIEECKRRDPKGLYGMSSERKIAGLAGVDSPYQAPANPGLRIDSSKLSVEEEVQAIGKLLAEQGVLTPGARPAQPESGAVTAALKKLSAALTEKAIVE